MYKFHISSVESYSKQAIGQAFHFKPRGYYEICCCVCKRVLIGKSRLIYNHEFLLIEDTGYIFGPHETCKELFKLSPWLY